MLSACDSKAAQETSNGQTIELVTPNYAPYLQTFSAAIGDAYTQRTGTKVKLINTGNSSFVSVNQRIQSDLAAGHTDALALVGVNDVERYVTGGPAATLTPSAPTPKRSTGLGHSSSCTSNKGAIWQVQMHRSPSRRPSGRTAGGGSTSPEKPTTRARPAWPSGTTRC